jgi:acyl transferase domain-containing protein
MSDSRERLLQVCGASPDAVVTAAEAALLSGLPPPQQEGRYRFATLGASADAVRADLAAWREKAAPVDEPPRPVVFVYSGQGSQYPQMGKALFETSGKFRDDVLEVLSFTPRGGTETARRLFDILQSDGQAINEINHTSPILFAFQVALTRLWKRWGVSPDAVVGHSFGEFPAAWCAGVFDVPAGMYLVSERGRLMNDYRLQSSTESRYCVLRADIGDIVELLAEYAGRVAVAGVNAPEISTISGSRVDIESVVAKLSSRGIKSRVLPVLVPAHSKLLDGTARDFAAVCAGVDFRVPALNWYSTLTGFNLRHESPVDGEYWRRHMVEPVRFWATMVQATENGPSLFLEIGPGETLTSMAAEAVEREDHHWVTSLSAREGGTRHLMNAALTLWQRGLAVDLDQARTELSVG